MNASGDIIATLSARVSELSKRVAILQAEFDSATKRLAVYEENDGTIQEALSGALRAAYQIRERAEITADQILEQAREERRMLLQEIERLRDERDRLQEDIASQRRSGIAALAPRPLSSDTAAAELRAVASEALRGLFQELVDEVRSTQRAAAPAPPPPPAAAAPAPSRAPEPAPAPRYEPPAATTAEPPTYEAMRRLKEARLSEVEELPATLSGPSVEIEEVAPAVEAEAPEVAQPPPPPAPVPEAPAREPVAAPPPLEVLRAVATTETLPPRVEAAAPTADIQLVLSPVASFPRLVEIERRIQALPVVRTLYVRDFRAATATLAVALRSAMTPEEFAGVLSGLQQPRLRLLSGAGHTLELRVEGEAGAA